MKSRKSVILCGLLAAALCALSVHARKKERRSVVCIETTEGVIRVALSDDTPFHRDNFLNLVDEQFYDSMLFHRVIPGFVIQCGDPSSRKALPGQPLGEGDVGYTLPAEFCLPYLYHCRGALAAARKPDNINPEMESSGSQFYIVYGKVQNNEDIRRVQDVYSSHGVEMTSQMQGDYEMRGGLPALDGVYTVFGEVIQGLDVVKSIQEEPTDSLDRPLRDIRVLRMTVEQRSAACEKK